MQNFIKVARAFYAIGIAGLGLQQLYYADFRPVILQKLTTSFPGLAIWAYLAGAGLVVAGGIILWSKRAKLTALILALVLFILFICTHIIFQLFLSPYSFHLGLWTDPLKELALSGGALLIAGSYTNQRMPARQSSFINLLEKCIPLGRIFFSITMILFGIDHFIYPEFVATLVPSWIPGHVFWTYFAGVALAGAGICLMLKIQLKLVGLLLGLMLFLWLIVLHVPRAVVAPAADNGNELTSVFEALAFSGIAFIIALTARKSFS